MSPFFLLLLPLLFVGTGFCTVLLLLFLLLPLLLMKPPALLGDAVSSSVAVLAFSRVAATGCHVAQARGPRPNATILFLIFFQAPAGRLIGKPGGMAAAVCRHVSPITSSQQFHCVLDHGRIYHAVEKNSRFWGRAYSGGSNVSENFFDESKDQSVVKATIVTKYFSAWAQIIGRAVKNQGGQKICYIDLFCGPGTYKDGTASTPIRVLEEAIADPLLRDLLVTIFNDREKEHCESLQAALEGLPGYENLRNKPVIINEEVGDNMVQKFGGMKVAPSLFFVDPWGYKGLSVRLVNALVKDWACECVFFFNYNRVNMHLNNPQAGDLMKELFGEQEFAQLTVRLESLGEDDREYAVVEELAKALNPTGNRFVLPFRFKNARGTRTSHHLIHVSKSFLGYDIMKGIMARESSATQEGVPSFEYNLADRRFPMLFDLARPLSDLEEMLPTEFSAKTLTFKQLYERHSVGKRYVESNYRQVLSRLEDECKLVAVKLGGKRRKHEFSKDVSITFARRA
jgi:three-Cys-motif partner protein